MSTESQSGRVARVIDGESAVRPGDGLLPTDEPVGFQVWHRRGAQYEHVASVPSNALGAVMMTTHGFLGHERWYENPAVTAEPGEHRSTDIGDVLVGPDGRSLEIAMEEGLRLRPIAAVDRMASEGQGPPLAREAVDGQIRQLKAGTEWRTIGGLDIVRDQTLDGRSWGDLTEAQKLDQLQLGTDVGLLDPQQRRELLAREVDLARIVPTGEQIRAVIDRVQEVIAAPYFEGVEYEVDDPPSRPGLEALRFRALTPGDRVEILAAGVDWDGFTAGQRGTVIRRVLEGQGPESWMEGIAPAAGPTPDPSERGAADPATDGTYQVWHDRGWPQSRLDQVLGGAPLSRFPEDYFHAADVRAGRLEDAVRWTTSTGRALHGDHRPWDENPGVRSYTPRPFLPRDTDAGDVIVDPRGRPHRVTPDGFAAIDPAADRAAPGPGRIDPEPTPQARAERIAAFHDGIAERHREVGSGWATATEEEKLRDLYFESRGVVGGLTVPGSAVLAAIEQHIDVSGLPAIQRTLVDDLRAGLDAGLPEPADRIDTALEQIVDAGLFEESLRNARERTDRPWAEIPEDHKVGRIIAMARDSGVWTDWWEDLHGTTPGAHVLATIESAVDVAQLSPWRRDGLERLRARVDADELAERDGDRPGRGDRVSVALRLAELEATIADFRHAGADDPDPGRHRRWGHMRDKAKLDEILNVVGELGLESEPDAYAIAAAAVDMRQLPAEMRREFEEMRAAAEPIGTAADRGGAAPGAFDRLMADAATVAPAVDDGIDR